MSLCFWRLPLIIITNLLSHTTRNHKKSSFLTKYLKPYFYLLARGMGSLQGKLNIDHRDISRHLNNFAINLLPEVHWKTNFTALEFPEMPTIEDVFPVLRYNCSLEYYGRTNKTLLCGVQNSWQDLVKFLSIFGQSSSIDLKLVV